MNHSTIRSRWAAIGAAVAVTLGAGGIGLVSATSPADATAYIPIEPCRVADTRAGEFNIGDKSSPLGPRETHTIEAHGDNGECTGIPTTATGLQLNVTSINATAGTFLAVWGSGDRPNSSNLNPQPNQPPIPNAVTTGLTGDGEFNIYNQAGSVDVFVDIVGYYADHHHDDRYYQKREVDAALASKANSADVYTQAQLDAALGQPVMAGNGEGVGGSACAPGELQILVRDAQWRPVNGRFSFIVPDHSYGQIRQNASVRTGTDNVIGATNPSPGEYCVQFSGVLPTQLQAESTVASVHGEG